MRNHVHIPNESGQYVSAQSYESSILVTINSFPMHASTVIPMAQAVEFAELILSIAKHAELKEAVQWTTMAG